MSCAPHNRVAGKPETGGSLFCHPLIMELHDLLQDWPTMRALSASGAAQATANKVRAREIVAELMAR